MGVVDDTFARTAEIFFPKSAFFCSKLAILELYKNVLALTTVVPAV